MQAPFTRRRALLPLAFAATLLAAASGGGCTSLLGDFDVAPSASAGGDLPDGAVVTDGGATTVTEGGVVCNAPARACPGDRCLVPSPDACGPGCVACPPGANGATAICRPDGTCGIRCEAGLTPCGNACRDLTKDPDHCGQCGRACGGGGCNAGRCEPVIITTGLVDPTDIAVSPTEVFVNADGVVRKCAKTGCPSTTPLWSGNTKSVRGPHMLGTDLNYAYFAVDLSSNRYPYRCSLAGCAASPEQIVVTPAPNSSNFETFTLEGGSFLFTGTYTGVREVPLAGGAGGRTYSNSAGTGVAGANASFVVWSDKFGSGVRQCARAGAGCMASSNLIGLVTTTELIVVADRAIFAVSDGAGSKIQACNVAGCSGAPTTIATLPNEEVTGLAADITGIYWTTSTNTDGAVKACKVLGGCGATPLVLATGQRKPIGIALDQGFVYWVNNTDGAVRRVAK